MERIRIVGGSALSGTVSPEGAKNAALPILFATLLGPGPHHIRNVPALSDITTTQKLLTHLGVRIVQPNLGHFEIDASQISTKEAPYDLVRTMRASALCLGPLLARFGQARVSLPGGCAIGARPLDIHLSGLEALGATFEIEQGYINGKVLGQLKGTDFTLKFPSVGATENLMMAAVLAQGKTVLRNCAQEPEIRDLGLALQSMGARIEGAGTTTMIIDGVDSLNAMNHVVLPDRIEAGTFIAAALLTQSEITITKIYPEDLHSTLDAFRRLGAEFDVLKDSLIVKKHHGLKAASITTAPHPGFATDMQAQWMTVALTAQGGSTITETIFENRFMHVPELCRLGANAEITGNTVTVRGPCKLTGATVMATDLRASASLILAGLVARGETYVRRIYHLDRGYVHLEKKLNQLGAQCFRETES